MALVRLHLQVLKSLAAKSKAKEIEWMQDICVQLAAQAAAAIALANSQANNLLMGPIRPMQPDFRLHTPQTTIFDDPMPGSWATGASDLSFPGLDPFVGDSAFLSGDYMNEQTNNGSEA
jgi:hypothetical protein